MLNMSSSSLIRMNTNDEICVSAAAGTLGMVRLATHQARQEGSKAMERQIAEMAINPARADG